MTEVSNTPGTVDLSGAPAGLDEATFDSLFPAEPSAVTVAPQAPQTQQPAPAAPAATSQPQAAPATSPGPYLKGDRSVYNTPEAAIEGINQKDALIEQMRQRYALATGVDPITGQPIGQTAQPQQSDDYTSNSKKYLDDLYSAAKDGGPQAYVDVQRKFLFDSLKPLQPMIQRMAREQAVESLSGEIKEVGTYLNSPAYKQALDANPVLRDAISIAESDINQHSRLPGLYKLAYFTGQGQQLPEILKAQASQTQTQNQTQQTTQVRPTVQSLTPSLPAAAARPTLGTIEGIRATIAEQEALGAKLTF